MKAPLLYVNYGEGKGKTTAALGQALRAYGRGWRVLVVQFLKESRAKSGEVAAARELGSRFRMLRAELPAPVLEDAGPAGRRAIAAASRELLARALHEARRGRCDLLVLDEALTACHLRFLTVAAVRAAVRAAGAAGVKLVVATGRWAPASILRAADLVTEMRKVKHPYDRGVKARDGIEY
jgi:cob(I)alamin adenosyltransferase